jgi:uncharacterized RDD family membrane protein YckC
MTDWTANRPALRDYSRSRAVVMGTWEYDYLPGVPTAGSSVKRLPAVENSLRRMVGLLTGPQCGWPRDRLLRVENEPDAGRLPNQLISAFEDVEDVALFYYVGHGQISQDDQLCLGLVKSSPDARRRNATSLRFADLREALRESPARFKIIVLDCCFAGLVASGTLAGSPDDVLDRAGGTNAYTMAATRAFATAWYEDDPGLNPPQTYFTKYLADLIEKGIPGQGKLLQMDPLFWQLRENLAVAGLPVPERRAVNDAREFAFAYNAAWLDVQHDRDQELGWQPNLAVDFGPIQLGGEPQARRVAVPGGGDHLRIISAPEWVQVQHTDNALTLRSDAKALGDLTGDVLIHSDGGAAGIRVTASVYEGRGYYSGKKLATFGQRAVAAIIDLLLLIPGVVLLEIANPGGSEHLLALNVIGGAAMAVPWLYNRCYLQGGNGQSWGKRALGLKLIRMSDSEPARWWKAALRDAARVPLLYEGFLLGLLLPLVDARRQTLADKITRTVVISAQGRRSFLKTQ